MLAADLPGTRLDAAKAVAVVRVADGARQLERSMTDPKWVMGFGAFLFLCGLAGFLSNPAAAKTALISGSVFGGVCALCGWLLGRGIGAARWAALGTTLLLAVVFSWRSTASWQAVSAGQPKTFAAILITLMLLGSLATVLRLLLWRRPSEVEPQ